MTFWCVELCINYEGTYKQKFFKELENASAQVEEWKLDIIEYGTSDFYVTLEEVEFEDT